MEGKGHIPVGVDGRRSYRGVPGGLLGDLPVGYPHWNVLYPRVVTGRGKGKGWRGVIGGIPEPDSPNYSAA